MNDIRWIQRLNNYRKALKKLAENIIYIQDEFEHHDIADEARWQDITLAVQDIFKQGLIQSFEFTHELAWNLLKDYLEYQGNSELRGSRDTVRESLKVNLIQDGDVWMDMIQSRNKTSHTYNEDTANAIFVQIITAYFPCFQALERQMERVENEK